MYKPTEIDLVFRRENKNVRIYSVRANTTFFVVGQKGGGGGERGGDGTGVDN